MSRIIAIANQKGGVGKTTTSVNLASALGSMQKRVLLLDLDPQGNATMGCGVDKNELELSVYDLLVEDVPVNQVAQQSEANNCDLLPANADLTAAEVELMAMDAREQKLNTMLEPARGTYDYILIDCPPSLNILTLNAFVAADSVLVPIQCEYYALEGLSALLETIEGVREAVNPTLEIEGLLRTMYDGRNNLGVEVSAQLIEHFGEQVFRTIVPRNVRLAEAPSHGVSIVGYDKNSRGALAYLALAGEIIRRRALFGGNVGGNASEKVSGQVGVHVRETADEQSSMQASGMSTNDTAASNAGNTLNSPVSNDRTETMESESLESEKPDITEKVESANG